MFGVVRVLDLSILVGTKWYHIAVLICFSLVTYEAEYLHVLIWHLCMFFGEMSVKVFVPY